MKYPVTGCGLGLRTEFLDELIQFDQPPVDFLEIVPENWMETGGYRAERLAEYTSKYPTLCHGLSLSIGSPKPLDESFILQLKQFFKQYGIVHYSEHLSFCSDSKGQLYDLIPMPFTIEAADYVADRVKRVQDILGEEMSLENISYYTPLSTTISELDFIHRVLEKADCGLLLDVNNIYVNSINHQYDAEEFCRQLPGDRIRYVHVAGHRQEKEDLLIDTHGAPVTDPVWDLLAKAYEFFGPLPTLLERDNDVPALSELLAEVGQIKHLLPATADEVAV